VIRPFPEAAVVAALKGKKNVIILERTDEALSGDNPLGRDIRTALSKAIKTEGRPSAEGCHLITLEEVPRILGGTYGLGSRDFRPEHIIGAYEFATAGPRAQGRQDRGRWSFVHGAGHRPSLFGGGR
jgi:pyruvate-ferredoxin/flavodoxin oxidoreductase